MDETRGLIWNLGKSCGELAAVAAVIQSFFPGWGSGGWHHELRIFTGWYAGDFIRGQHLHSHQHCGEEEAHH